MNSGLLFERTRKNLLKLSGELYHPKNWRPIILAMSGGGWTRPHLAILGHWLTSGHGILNLGQVIQGEVEDMVERIINQEDLLEGFIVDQKLDAFPTSLPRPQSPRELSTWCSVWPWCSSPQYFVAGLAG